jgi:release factor glutamine methyltransferase
LYLSADREIAREPAERYLKMLERRSRREPLAYITGEREFWSKDFHVSPAVLIPRPETEFLVEKVLTHADPGNRKGRCLDLCCGSGVIAVILATEMRRSVIAADISAAALEVAAINIARHNVSSRVSLVQAELMSCFLPDHKFSLIVSNPPYVSTREIVEELEPEVARYEPRLALDGGESGVDVIAMIRDSLPEMLTPGGDCFIEIGDGQGDALKSLFLAQNDCCFRFVEIYRDYSGRERVAHIRKNTN